MYFIAGELLLTWRAPATFDLRAALHEYDERLARSSTSVSG